MYHCIFYQVPATEPLVVTGLQPNEMYIFAVAAYAADGKLIGGSIGDTSRPLIASHDMPVVVLWGFLTQVRRCVCMCVRACSVRVLPSPIIFVTLQCAYQCKVNGVALRAAQTLRKHFVSDDQDPT